MGSLILVVGGLPGPRRRRSSHEQRGHPDRGRPAHRAGRDRPAADPAPPGGPGALGRPDLRHGPRAQGAPGARPDHGPDALGARRRARPRLRRAGRPRRRTGWLVEPWRMLRALPNMVSATISLGLLVLVAVTSVRVARNKVGYERWHLVHLTAYAAVVLSIPHQLSVGTDIAGHPLVRAYWLGLYVLTAGSLVWWRFLVPARPLALARAVRRARGPGGAGRLVGLDPRAAAGPDRGSGRAVLHLAVPGPRHVARRPPVVAVGGARGQAAPDHRARARRPLRPAAPAAARHAGPDRGTVRRVHRRAPPAPPGDPGRGRHRHHARPRARRAADRRLPQPARATSRWSTGPTRPTSWRSGARAGRPGRADRAGRALPGRPAGRVVLAAPPGDPRAGPDGAALGRARAGHRAARRLRVRPGRAGWTWCTEPAPTAGVPRQQVHDERFAW